MFKTHKKYKFKKTYFIISAVISAFIFIIDLHLISNLKLNSIYDLSYKGYFYFSCIPFLLGVIGFLIVEVIRKKDNFFLLNEDSISFCQNGKENLIYLEEILEIKVEDLEEEKGKQTIYILTNNEQVELCLRHFSFDISDLMKEISKDPKTEGVKVEYIK